MASQRVAVVTGGNKGIGFAIIRALCKRFQGIVYLTARDSERGAQAIKDLQGEGLNPKFHLLDVANEQSIDVFKKYLVKQYGGVDAFVHNAGIAYKQASTAPFGEQAEVTLKVNFFGTVDIGNSILPILKQNGRLVNLSSGVSRVALAHCSQQNQDYFKAGDLTEEDLITKLNEFIASAKAENHEQHGFPSTAYGMSKIGVNAFTRILGKRARALEKNILVNCCCPGWVRTDMAGPKARRSPEEGAVTPTNLALIPEECDKPNGKFVKDGNIIKWY